MTTSPSHKLGLSLDPGALHALQRQGKDAPEAALRGAAKQFEALFLDMMLKSMRQTVPQDGAFDSEQTRMFTGMLDQQYASELSEGHGLGLADMIVRQLAPLARGRKGTAAAAADETATAVSAPPGTAAGARTAVPAGGRSSGAVQGAAGRSAALGVEGSGEDFAEAGDELPDGLAGAAQAGPAAAAADPGLGGATAARRRTAAARGVGAFRAEMSEAASAASAASGIPADFMIAQAGLESGWGRHQPLAPDGSPSHNLFGIKAGPNWHGPVATALTTEYVDGVPHRVAQDFRAYASYAEAFQDYAGLLSGSARYARALSASSAQDFAGALQQAGYATDPDYAGKVRRAIRQVGGERA